MGERLTVAHLVRPVAGGIATHVQTLLAGLDRARFDPVLICPPDIPLYREAERGGYPTFQLPIAGELHPWRDLRAMLALRRLLGRIKPDLLHMHGTKAALIGRGAVASGYRPRTVVTFHTFNFDERVSARKRRLVLALERRMARYTDAYIAVSQALGDELLTRMGTPAAKTHVIRNGIVFADGQGSPVDTATTGPCIGVVSRLAPQKGVEYFVQAVPLVLRQFPTAQFVIVGDGPLRDSLQELAHGLGVAGAVRFLGLRTDVPQVLHTLQVFVLPSTWEAFGLTLVEAMGQGVPVVASRVGGIPEIVDGARTGLLVEPGNPQEIATQVCRLLDDQALAARLGAEGRRFARAAFSSDRMIRETQELYLAVAKPTVGAPEEIAG